MRFFVTALFAAISMASPQSDRGGTDNSEVKFPVDPKITIKQAQAKCGYDAQVSCCNKVIYTHDITTSSTGPLPGVVQTALDGGPGNDGLGRFSQCNDMTAKGNSQCIGFTVKRIANTTHSPRPKYSWWSC